MHILTALAIAAVRGCSQVRMHGRSHADIKGRLGILERPGLTACLSGPLGQLPGPQHGHAQLPHMTLALTAGELET